MPVDTEKHTIDILYSFLLAFYISLFILPNVIGVTRYVDLSFTLLNMHIPIHMSLGGVAFPIIFLSANTYHFVMDKRQYTP